MGVKCSPLKNIGSDENGDVVFILCKAVGGKIKPNHEFLDANFFSPEEIDDLNTYNVANIVRTGV